MVSSGDLLLEVHWDKFESNFIVQNYWVSVQKFTKLQISAAETFKNHIPIYFFNPVTSEHSSLFKIEILDLISKKYFDILNVCLKPSC